MVTKCSSSSSRASQSDTISFMWLKSTSRNNFLHTISLLTVYDLFVVNNYSFISFSVVCIIVHLHPIVFNFLEERQSVSYAHFPTLPSQ
jgi:hypothetical protein